MIMIGDFYLGDPLIPTTIKLGPLTTRSFGQNIVLQNLSKTDIVVGSYKIPVNRYLNHPEGVPYSVLGIEGTVGQIGPWEQWSQSGNLVISWDGYVYVFVPRPQL